MAADDHSQPPPGGCTPRPAPRHWHATCFSALRELRNMQPASWNTQRALQNIKHTTSNEQCNTPSAACHSVHRAASTVHRAACMVQCASRRMSGIIQHGALAEHCTTSCSQAGLRRDFFHDWRCSMRRTTAGMPAAVHSLPQELLRKAELVRILSVPIRV